MLERTQALLPHPRQAELRLRREARRPDRYKSGREEIQQIDTNTPCRRHRIHTNTGSPHVV